MKNWFWDIIVKMWNFLIELPDVMKAKRKHTGYSLDGTETKLLVFGSKHQIHKGFPKFTRKRKLESTREIIWQKYQLLRQIYSSFSKEIHKEKKSTLPSWNFKEIAYCNKFNIAITKISIILQSIAMTSMKLQWIYYYNDLIPIILQSIVRKNMKNLTIIINIPLQ